MKDHGSSAIVRATWMDRGPSDESFSQSGTIHHQDVDMVHTLDFFWVSINHI